VAAVAAYRGRDGAVEVLDQVAAQEIAQHAFDPVRVVLGPKIELIGDRALQLGAAAPLFLLEVSVDDSPVIGQRAPQRGTYISHIDGFRRRFK